MESDTTPESNTIASTNQIHIISANPGMGKSVLLDRIAQKAPTDKWVLRIDLNKHQDYYESLEYESKNTQYREHINYFRTSGTELNNKIFEKVLENKDIIILLDGFDDISLSHKKEVTNMIKSFIRNGFCVWLTTRPMMKSYLEEMFNTFAFTLVLFAEETQNLFLKKYFNADRKLSNLENLLQEFTEKLLKAFKRNIADLKAEFTGTPLHIELLAECFSDDCERFLCNEGKVNFNENFDLLDLFDKFIQRKIKILCDKYGPGSKDLRVIYKDYQSICALKVLFPLHKHIIDEYFDDHDDYTVQHIQLLQKEGILITDENFNVSFVHRTFAEYLAAQWLSKNLNNKNQGIRDIIKILIAQRFKVDFSVTENYKFALFDRFLSRNYNLHLSIIYGKLDKNEFSSLNITTIDEAGRSVLHLIALYVRQYPTLLNCSLLIEKLLEENFKLRTDLLGYNPLDYALMNNSIDMANLICEKWTNSKINIYIDSRLQIKYLNNSLFTNYKFLFKALLPYFSYRNIILKNVSLYQTVHSYLIHFLSPACLHEYGQMKISDLSNLEMYMDRNNLYYRVMLADKDNIKKLLQNYKEINKRNIEGKTVLHYAVLQNEFEIVNSLLLNGADINARKLETSVPFYNNSSDLTTQKYFSTYLEHINDSGNTPIHYAILKGALRIIDLFLSKGASVNIKNYNGETSLHYGAKYGDLEIVDKLIYYKADINAMNKRGNTALHIAILKQKFDLVYLLLSKGADANLKNLNGSTSLHCCANKGDNNLLSKLMSLKVDINAQNIKGDTALHITISKGRSDLIFLLLVRGAKVNIRNFYGNTPLHIGVENDDIESVIKLISYNAEVNIQNINGYTPLHRAVLRNKSNIIDFLLSTNPDTNIRNSNGETPLHLSIRYCDVEIVYKLILHGADVNLDAAIGNTPLYIAIQFRKLDTVLLLLAKYNANADVQDTNGDTPLHYSIKFGILRVIENLLSYKASVNLHNNKGNTPLHEAVLHDKSKIVPLLLINGAAVDSTNCDGDTPLHLSLKSYNPEIMDKLISHKANVNAQNTKGCTPLHNALYYEKHEAVSYLLSNGADVNLKNAKGETPLYFLQKSDYLKNQI